MELKGKVAIVTGGGQGIGRAICQRLATAGANVVILDVNEAGGREVEGLIGRNAAFFKTDCTKKGEVDGAVVKIKEKFGKVDILANNIGWCRSTFFVDEDETYWEKVIAVNMKTLILATHAVLPLMAAQNSGKIVNIASDAGRVGQMMAVVYSACKGGTIAFTKALAREVARHKINVNCICPGPTDTPLYQGGIPDKVKAAFTNIIPFKRIAKPEEIADAVLFLVSPESDYITGQVLSVSGGLTMAG